MIGKTVCHYRILRQLGAGGMGVVYAGEDTRLGRSVALKFVPEDLARDPQALQRLQAEARTASGLNHPSICTIYDIGDFEGQPFIVMELLKGQTLRDRLSGGPLKIHEAVDLGIHVADALDSAHSHGVIHRDIKPANLYLVDRGPVKILDFGLAKSILHAPTAATTEGLTRDRTADGITLGTVSYMSPEQVTGEPLDGRTDLFSLGVVMYEALTGHQPFNGKTSAVIFSAILTRAPMAPVVFNPDLPLRLQEVINNCLEKDRELRYQDASGLRADLKRVKRDLESGRSGVFAVSASTSIGDEGQRTGVRGQGPVRAAEHGTSQSSTSAPGRRRVAAAISALLVAAAVVIGSSWVWSRGRTRVEPTRTVAAQEFIRTRLALAAASVDSKDYRMALAYADEVLRTAPDDPEALRIRETARQALKRFDAAIQTASERLAAGDTAAAASAVAEARAIDPAATAVGELSARLADRGRNVDRSNSADGSRHEARADTSAPAGPRAAQQTVSKETAPAASSRYAPTQQPPPRSPEPSPPAPVPSTMSAEQNVAPRPATPPSGAVTAAAVPDASTLRSTPSAESTAPTNAAHAVGPETAGGRRDPDPAPSRGTDSDDAAIRRVVATYARAIETKDLALFRTVKPNLSPADERRIEQGFRAVTSQQVNVTILSIDALPQGALVHLRRRDTISAGGREQTSETLQTMTLIHAAGGWVIRDIGR